MALHRLLLVVVATLLGAVAAGGVQFSTAAYTATSTAPVTVMAANDWTPPTVAMTDPGSPLSGTVTVAATAADARSSVASVTIQRAPHGSSTWTTICTATVAPYTCAWVTTAVADGTYQLRAMATDIAGYSAISAIVTTTVINNATVTLGTIADVVRGSVPLSLTVTGSAGASVTTRFESSVAGANSWSTITGCGDATGTGTTRSCTWVTSGAATYDVRAVAVIGSKTSYGTRTNVLVDNAAPSVTLTVPTGTLRGSVVLSASASDADSGVDTVSFQYKLASAGTWSVCGNAVGAPYTCTLDTASLANGPYDFRAVATDRAGNSTTSLTLNRTVDNTAPSVSIASPTGGSTIAGTVTVTAAANAVQGITSVRIEGRSGTSGTFVTICTDTTAPYSCSFDTTSVARGTYQMQAVLTPSSEAAVTSALVSVTIDNAPLTALDVQTVNVVTANQPAAGDQVVLTYSSLVNLSTIRSGWTGSSTAVTATFKDKNIAGAAIAGFDRLELTGANLGQVALVQDFVGVNKTVTMNGSTMTASTGTVAGVSVTVVTITLGNPSASGLVASTLAGAMRWTPSTLVTNLVGRACSATAATESGTNDRDF